MTRVKAETYVRVLNRADSDYRYEVDPYSELLVQLSRSDRAAGMEHLNSNAALARLRLLADRHNMLSEQCMKVAKQYSQRR